RERLEYLPNPKMDDRDKSDRRNRDRHSERDRDHKIHRSRHDSDDHRHHRSDRNAKHDHKTRDREDREGSRDRDRVYDRDEREGSRGRSKLKRDEEREDDLVEPRHSSHSHKRKDREHSEDRELEDKRIRVSEVKKERRKFGDKVKEDDYDNESKVMEEVTNGAHSNASPQNVRFFYADIGVAVGSPAAVPASVPESTLAPPPSFPIKVSSISTTNENKGVSITRSHEVTGKSSTDGSSSTAGKPGSLSIDALAKAKKALQMQKDLKEKLKRIPQLNKSSTSNLQESTHLGSKTESAAPSLGVGVITRPPTSTSSGPVPNMSIFPAAANPPASGTSAAGVTTPTNLEAVRRAQELAARMGFRHDPQFAPLINMFPSQIVTPDVTIPQKPTKAPVLRLDAHGREIDEHGNVVNVTKPSNLSTLKVNINKQKKDAFEIQKPVLEVDPDSNPHFDESIGINKTKLLRPKRMNFLFVEEGKWSKDAESIKLKSKFGEAQAKEQKAKQAQLAKAKAAPDINPNLIEITERVVIKEKLKDPIPEIEW
ncbi:hypothetical protein TSUD_00930, partial [Trifolium subterraneum]